MTRLRVAETPKVYTQKESQMGLICGKSHSGAIASYLWHPIMGTFAFVAVKLTTGTEFDKYKSNYENYRYRIHHKNIGCLMNIVGELIDNPNPAELKPDHVFLMGDFNSNIVYPGASNQQVIEAILKSPTPDNFAKFFQYDELTKAMTQYPLKGYTEGINAKPGPLFLPTWKLTRNRTERCEITEINKTINANCFDFTDGIGWHDRILTKDKEGAKYLTTGIQYNRLDIKNMHQSNQAGVIGVYQLIEHK
jgi:hypothetical protein